MTISPDFIEYFLQNSNYLKRFPCCLFGAVYLLAVKAKWDHAALPVCDYFWSANAGLSADTILPLLKAH